MLSKRHKMELRSRSKRRTCFVSLPDSTVFEIDYHAQSNGLEILGKVCDRLGIIETDYFGLAFDDGKSETLWLNLRNRIVCELSGNPQPYRLELRVKFFIAPHMIQQDVTRHQFYQNICEAFATGKLRRMTREQTAQFAAVIAQADVGDIAAFDREYYSGLVPTDFQCDDELLAAVHAEHGKLCGITPRITEYHVLQAASKLPSYGVCYHSARLGNKAHVHIAVGPEGVVLYNTDWTELSHFQYTAIQSLTHDSSYVRIDILNDQYSLLSHTFQLASWASACGLYRALTEKYYFYNCDTVVNEVRTQCCRNLKGTLAFFFNEKSDLGKSYYFDIQRTLTEAYDLARRTLYKGQSPVTRLQPTGDPTPDSISDGSMETTDTSADEKRDCDCCQTHCKCCQELHSAVEKFSDSLVCRVCADTDIDTAFVPCGHTICCTTCALQLESCPLCSAAITMRLRIFLPCTSLPVTCHDRHSAPKLAAR